VVSDNVLFHQLGLQISNLVLLYLIAAGRMVCVVFLRAERDLMNCIVEGFNGEYLERREY
jgi:hypothetical protein